MTVRELIDKLSTLDGDLPVFTESDDGDCFEASDVAQVPDLVDDYGFECNGVVISCFELHR